MIDSITFFLGLKDSEVEYCKDVDEDNPFSTQYARLTAKTVENAWTLKENYLLFNDSPGTPEEHREILEHLIDQFISSNIPEMINVGFTLSRWKEEILNSFYRIDKKVKDKNGNTQIKNVRVTSGPVEGRNKYIKILLRLANGYVNFGRFRNRAMYVLNKNELYSKTRLKNTVKITKKKKKS